MKRKALRTGGVYKRKEKTLYSFSAYIISRGVVEMERRVGEIAEIVKRMFLSGERKSALVLGVSGIGKSEVVKTLAKEIAKAMGRNFRVYREDEEYDEEKDFVFVDLRLYELEASDLSGIPEKTENYFVYKPPRWAFVLSKIPGVLFLDELTNVQRADIQAAAYKILLDRRVGFIELNRDVLIISAGNESDDSSIAIDLPFPLINRLVVFRAKEPTVEEWAQYMESTGKAWDKTVFAFLLANKQFFVQRGEGSEQKARPRQWSALAFTLAATEWSEEDIETIAIGMVGKEAGLHYSAFRRTKVPSIDELRKDLNLWNGLNEAQKYLMTLTIANADNEFIIKMFAKLFKEEREYIAVVCKIMKSVNKEKLIELFKKLQSENREIYDYIVKMVLSKR